MSKKNFSVLSVLLIGGLIAIGCGKSGSQDAPTSPASEVAGEGHNHEGWWCSEHGVPEEVCALCSTKIAADFKAKGDWCKEHDRPESECFICHPEKEAEFAALYEAKYGKKPPKPTAEEHSEDHEESKTQS